MEGNKELNEPDFSIFDSDEEVGLYYNCPNCGREYDEIDFEYQICHRCKHNAQD